MARIRSIHPDVTESAKLAAVSRDAGFTFLVLQTVCDDEGRAKAHSRLLLAKLYPLREDVTAEALEAELGELDTIQLIRLYEVDGDRYLDVPSWGKYQHPNRPTPSKLPPHPDRASAAPPSDLSDRSVNPPELSRIPRAGVEEERETGDGEGVGEATVVILEARRILCGWKLDERERRKPGSVGSERDRLIGKMLRDGDFGNPVHAAHRAHPGWNAEALARSVDQTVGVA